MHWIIKIWCLESNWELQSICILKLNRHQWISRQIHTGGLTFWVCCEKCKRADSRFYQGTEGLHLPIMLLASASDKQLTGNFPGSDINRQSQVPLIRAHITCKLGLINLKPSRSTRNEMFLEGADTLNESFGTTDSLITQTIPTPRSDLKVSPPFLGKHPRTLPSPLAT